MLHAWDARRADAWAHGDAGALRSLYVRVRRPGRADVRLLRAYGARGFVVRRLVTQVFAVSVLQRDPATMRLRVFDRVAGGEVVHDGTAWALSSTRRPASRVDRRSGCWRVGQRSGGLRRVSGSGFRPSRSTALTSGSAEGEPTLLEGGRDAVDRAEQLVRHLAGGRLEHERRHPEEGGSPDLVRELLGELLVGGRLLGAQVERALALSVSARCTTASTQSRSEIIGTYWLPSPSGPPSPALNSRRSIPSGWLRRS